MKNLTYKIQYGIFRFFRAGLLLFPENIRFAIGEKIAVLGYYLIRSRRITTLANIQYALPDRTKKERKRIAVEAYKTMGRAFLGTIWLEQYTKKDSNFHIHNIEIVEKACAKGPAVFATMHFGNMEAMLKFSEKYPFVTVAKKQRNPYLNKFISENRKHLNIILLEKSKKTSRELFEYAEQGKNIALFSDHRDKGTRVDFFGMNTLAPTGAATIALRYNRPLILGYCLFNKDNTVEVYFKEIPVINDADKNFKENVHETTQKLINVMEDVIMKHPEQWMWMHDRWRLYKVVKTHGQSKPE